MQRGGCMGPPMRYPIDGRGGYPRTVSGMEIKWGGMALRRAVAPATERITIIARKAWGKDVPTSVLPATTPFTLNNTGSVPMKHGPGTAATPFLHLRIRPMPGGSTQSGGVTMPIAFIVTFPRPITGATGAAYPVANRPAATYTDNRFHSGAPAILAGRFSFTFGAEEFI